jgi:hypothetical protein
MKTIGPTKTIAIDIFSNFACHPHGLLQLSNQFPYILDHFKQLFFTQDIETSNAALCVLNNTLVVLETKFNRDGLQWSFFEDIIDQILDLLWTSDYIPIVDNLILILYNLTVLFYDKMKKFYTQNVQTNLMNLFINCRKLTNTTEFIQKSITRIEINLLLILEYLATRECLLISQKREYGDFYTALLDRIATSKSELIDAGLDFIYSAKDCIILLQDFPNDHDTSTLFDTLAQRISKIDCKKSLKILIKILDLSPPDKLFSKNSELMVKSLIERFLNKTALDLSVYSLCILVSKFNKAKQIFKKSRFISRFCTMLTKGSNNFVEYGIFLVSSFAYSCTDSSIKTLANADLLSKYTDLLHSIDVRPSKQILILDCVRNLLNSNPANQHLLINLFKTNRPSIIRFCCSAVKNQTVDLNLFNSSVEVIKLLALNIEIKSLFFKLGMIDYIIESLELNLTLKRFTLISQLLQILIHITFTRPGQHQLIKTNGILVFL